MEFELCSLPCRAFEQTKIYVLHVLYDMFLYVQVISVVLVSMYVTVDIRLSGVCKGHDTH